MKILVVDDHVLIREALRGVLRELKDDAVILEAANSREAIRCSEENQDVELILLDLTLPDGSGFDVLAELRRTARSSSAWHIEFGESKRPWHLASIRS